MKHFYHTASSLEIFIPESVIEKSRGILFQENVLENGCMLFTRCNWVHSFLLKNPIKLYFFDSSFSVVNQVDYFPPNRFSPLVVSASYTLETALHFTQKQLQQLLPYFQEILST